MPYRDDLEAALRRAEALEADRDAEAARADAPDSDETVELRRQLSAARMQVAELRTARFDLERSLRGARAELKDQKHALEMALGQTKVMRARLETYELEHGREREARRWAVRAAQEAAEALREARLERASFRDAMEEFEARAIERERQRTRPSEVRRRLLEWVTAEPAAPGGMTTIDALSQTALGRFVARFGPQALRAIEPERRAGRLRELLCRIARSVWVEGDETVNFEPALLLLGAAGHVLAPRHQATLRFDVRSDGLTLEWLAEQPLEVRLSAADGFAMRGVRRWVHTPLH